MSFATPCAKKKRSSPPMKKLPPQKNNKNTKPTKKRGSMFFVVAKYFCTEVLGMIQLDGLIRPCGLTGNRSSSMSSFVCCLMLEWCKLTKSRTQTLDSHILTGIRLYCLALRYCLVLRASRAGRLHGQHGKQQAWQNMEICPRCGVGLCSLDSILVFVCVCSLYSILQVLPKHRTDRDGAGDAMERSAIAAGDVGLRSLRRGARGRW